VAGGGREVGGRGGVGSWPRGGRCHHSLIMLTVNVCYDSEGGRADRCDRRPTLCRAPALRAREASGGGRGSVAGCDGAQGGRALRPHLGSREGFPRKPWARVQEV
jgi:hypothetical protein